MVVMSPTGITNAGGYLAAVMRKKFNVPREMVIQFQLGTN